MLITCASGGVKGLSKLVIVIDNDNSDDDDDNDDDYDYDGKGNCRPKCYIMTMAVILPFLFSFAS